MLLKKIKKTEENCFDPPILAEVKLNLFLFFFLTFASLNFNNLFAQQENNFIFSLGFSLFDLNNESTAVDKLSDYFNPSDWSTSFGGSFEKEINDRITIGIRGSWKNLIEINIDNSENYKVAAWTFSTLSSYKFRKSSEASLQPYVLGDFGLTRFNEQNSLSLGLGLGFYYWFTERLGLKANSLWKYTFAPGNSSAIDTGTSNLYFQHFIGLSYRFGSARNTNANSCLY